MVFSASATSDSSISNSWNDDGSYAGGKSDGSSWLSFCEAFVVSPMFPCEKDPSCSCNRLEFLSTSGGESPVSFDAGMGMYLLFAGIFVSSMRCSVYGWR